MASNHLLAPFLDVFFNALEDVLGGSGEGEILFVLAGMGFHSSHHFQLTASPEDVEKVLPQLVKENSNGYLGVRHDRLVGLLIESVKDQQKQIDDLKREVKELKNG